MFDRFATPFSGRAEAAFDPLPFDTEAARAYGRIHAASMLLAGRREEREFSMMIAAIACSVDIPLYTRNPSDFTAPDGLVEVVAI